MQSSVKLREYQIEAIDKIASSNGKLLVNACAGAGKTYIPLYLRKRYPALKKVLVVCPASVKDQWRYVINTIFPEDTVFVAKGAYKTEYAEKILEADFVIINYDILFSRTGAKSWTSVLTRADFKLLVVDESHKVGNKDSNRSKCLYDIGCKVPYRILLTATPLTSNISGLWGQLHIIDPLQFVTQSKFMNYFAPPEPQTIFVKNGNGKKLRIWKPGKIHHLDELQDIIQKYCYVIGADEVYKHLAGVQRTEIPCVIEDKAVLDAVNEIKKHSIHSSLDMRKAKDMLTASRQLLGKAKVSIAVSWLKDYLEGTTEKIVVFAYHRAVVEDVADKLGKVAVKFYGGMSEKEKEANKSAFINNPDVRVIVMNIDTCTGVDGLNTVSRTCFYVENTGLPGLFDQSEGRVRRANSTFDAYFTYMLKADVLDGAILDVMWERKKLFDSIMTGKEMEVQVEDEAVDVIRKLKGE